MPHQFSLPFTAPLTKRQRGVYARTVHGLVAAIEHQVSDGYTGPLTIYGATVFAAGGPAPHYQPGPTVVLRAANKVWTATRIHHRGRVAWAVDLRVDDNADELLAPLIAEVGHQLGRELTAREAIDEAVRLLRERAASARAA